MFGLSSIAIEAIGAAIVALLIFAGGMKLEYDLDAAKITKMELSYAQAQQKAVAEAAAKQKAEDDQATAAATSEAANQSQLATSLQQQLAEVKSHVTSKPITCITWGFVRVLDAAVSGISASSINLGPGKSDDACSPFTADQLAAFVVQNYGIARANAEQLNALQDLLRKQGVNVH